MVSKIFQSGGQAGDVSFNMTPMIDCTFQLIIFFVLTSQIASTGMEVPQVLKSEARPRGSARGNLVVNVLPADTGDGDPHAGRYEVEGQSVSVGNVETLVRLFTQRRDLVGADRLAVEVRADYRVPFADVEPVLQAAAAAGIAKINLAARLRSDGQPGRSP